MAAYIAVAMLDTWVETSSPCMIPSPNPQISHLQFLIPDPLIPNPYSLFLIPHYSLFHFICT